MGNFQRDLEEYKKLNAEIIGVSDDDMETLEEFIKENGIE
ncbi:peroxiredoxin family protein, partial [Thermodesulfobacteriota bacterium]